MEWNKVYVSDALTGLKGLPDGSVQTVVTSPPYFQQRDYGHPLQWGQEARPEAYVNHLVELFVELRRVLRKDGTVWLVLGDSYASAYYRGKKDCNYIEPGALVTKFNDGIRKKDLLGIPWMVAFALRKQGWYLRQDIIWYKTNPKPEMVKDRCTRSHEYIFMFTKSDKYFYNHLAIATPISQSTRKQMRQIIVGHEGIKGAGKRKNSVMKPVNFSEQQKTPISLDEVLGEYQIGDKNKSLFTNRKSVWQTGTAMSKEGHNATFPPMIPKLCILAGSREGDLVLDPFMGTGTTLLQASTLGRQYIGFDLNEKYVAIARRRLKAWEGIFYKE